MDKMAKDSTAGGKGGLNFIDKMAADAIAAKGQRVLTQAEIDEIIKAMAEGKPAPSLDAAPPKPSSLSSGRGVSATSAKGSHAQSRPSDDSFSEDEINALLSNINKKKSKTKPPSGPPKKG
jgi:hypothetical protein